MRILHITPHYWPAVGGAETFTKAVSERLVQRGHDVTVLTLNSGALPARELVEGVSVRRFRAAGRLHDLFNGVLSIPGTRRLLGLAVPTDTIQMCAESPYGLHAFLGSIRANPDVVAVINWYGGWLPYQTSLARQLRGFALVGVPLFHTEYAWSQAAHQSDLLAGCDAVVAMTAHERAFIEQRSTQSNACVVGVGVDPLQFAQADGRAVRARHGIGDAPLVGYVGRMTAYKGVATLLDAMKQVWETEPTARLLLAGPGLPVGGPDDVARALAGLSPDERARIIAIDRFSDAEKTSLYDALDVFAMPSVGESFGIAYLEAWICGKPVIGSRVGSTECVIEDGVDGALVTPGHAGELAGVILRLLSDRALRERMGRAGRAKTLSRFTWDKIVDKMEDVYDRARTTTLTGGRESPSKCA